MATKKTTGKKTPVKVGKNREVGYKKPPKDTRWKPGQSGNPAGRPKSRTLSEELRARLEEKYPRRTDATYQRMVVEALVDRAINGDVTAIREVFDRTEGKPRQAIDVTGDQKRLSLIERTIAALMEKMERDEAIAYLSTLKPEINQWIN